MALRKLLLQTLRRLRSYIWRRSVGAFGLLWLIPFCILESLFFIEVLSNHNYLEIFPRELVFPTVLNLITALVIAIVVFWFRKPRGLAGKLVAAGLLGSILGNYGDRLSEITALFRAVLPWLPKQGDDLPLISLVFLVLLFAAALVIGRWVERLQSKHAWLSGNNIIAAVLIMTGFMFGGQTLQMTQILPELIAQSRITAPSLGKPAGDVSEKPDIYYIVLDRYANNTVLQKYFDFDNSAFTNALRKQNFVVNDTALSNYPYTTMSVASTLNATYTHNQVAPFADKEVQSRVLYHNMIHQSSVIKALRTAGYTYHNVGSTYGATNRAPLANTDHMYERELTVLGAKKRLRDIEVSHFAQSPFYEFTKFESSWWPAHLVEREGAAYIRDQLTTLNDLAGSPQQGGRFIFAHVLVPHDPYYFNADGSLSIRTGKDSVDRPVKQKYTSQVEFINSQIQQTVNTIMERSGGRAVVILNADEGPHPNAMFATFMQPSSEFAVVEDGITTGDMSQWPQEWLETKFGILQAVHIPRATSEDFQHLSSVNVFSIVLNRYLGYDLDYLPECHFTTTEGGAKEFRYTDSTAQLRGTSSKFCTQQQTAQAE